MIPKCLTLALMVTLILSSSVNGAHDSQAEGARDDPEASSTEAPSDNNADGATNQPQNDSSPSNSFKIPTALSEDEDSFIMNGRTEYIIVKKQLTFAQAAMFCDAALDSRLALVTNEDSAKFIVEAISETNEDLDNLWIGLRKINNSLIWINSVQGGESILEKFDEKNLKKYFVDRSITTDSKNPRECMAIGRLMHDVPLLVDLSCASLRGFVCERNYSKTEREIGGSIHPSWIRVGDWEYKIFHEQKSYNDAGKRCFEIDHEANLAVVPDAKVVKLLGRYLLIGRPSLENAWIGARFDKERNSWVFERTNQVIPDTRQKDTNYPPWRLNRKLKRQGCGLLDRHISNETLFVEARCERIRPFICSRKVQESKDVKVLDHPALHDKDYRLHLDHKPFDVAKSVCSKQQGKLAEPKTATDVSDLIHVMAENRTTVNHLWVGSEYLNDTWVYSSDKSPLEANIIKSYLLKNITYIAAFDQDNLCMDLDRENHQHPIIYGTKCAWVQAFICEWPKGKMGASDNEKLTDVTTPPSSPKTSPQEEGAETFGQ